MNRFLVSFDFWDTLVKNISYKKKRLEIISVFLNEHGYERSADEIKAAYGLIRQRIEQNKTQEANIYTCLEERITVLFQNLRVCFDNNMVVRMIDDLQKPIFEAPPPLIPGVRDILQYLSTFADIVCVSDTGMTSGESVKYILDYHKINKYFKYYIFSEDIGYNKPDKRMFEQLVCNAEGIPVDRIYHVGNRFETDVMGAVNAEIHPVWFADQTEENEKCMGEKKSLIVTDMNQIKALLKGED